MKTLLAITLAFILFTIQMNAHAFTEDELIELIEAIQEVTEGTYDFWILPDEYEEEYLIDIQQQQVEV